MRCAVCAVRVYGGEFGFFEWLAWVGLGKSLFDKGLQCIVRHRLRRIHWGNPTYSIGIAVFGGSREDLAYLNRRFQLKNEGGRDMP